MNIILMQKDLETKKAEVKTLMGTQMAAAEKDTRERTAEEIKAVDDKLGECRALQGRIDQAIAAQTQTTEIERLTAGMVPNGGAAADAPAHERRSMGLQFTESAEYRAFIRSQMHRRAGSWSSPTIELQATTLDTTSGSGGPLIQPQILPGINPLFFRRLTVSDLVPSGTTDSNALLYLKEKTFTNAAASVTEGAAKPESTLVFENATSPVQKIAHWLPVTEEMLEDFSAIRAYIDARLRLGLDLTKEDELLNGSGTPPHLTGIMTASGLTTAVARGADSIADAIFKQITAIATTALIQPDGIVLNPINWQTVQLTKNANGNYLGSGPWSNAQPAQLWGYPVAVTPAIVANTGLVGAFGMCCQQFQKGGVRVEVSNSHSDFFVRNLVAIRAEERLALCIYRPAGFGKVTGLN